MANDILLDENDDLLIANGDLVIGDSEIQEVSIIARLIQGELKEDPLLGPNLIFLIKGNGTPSEVEQKMRLHLARDGKNYEELQELINLNTNDEND